MIVGPRLAWLLFVGVLVQAAAGVLCAEGADGRNGARDVLPGYQAIESLIEDGKYADAERLARAALLEMTQAHGADSLPVAYASDMLVEALYRGGKAEDPETRKLAEHALRIKGTLLGPGDLELAHTLSSLGEVLRQTGELASARSLLEQALKIRESAEGQTDRIVAASLNRLANVLLDLGSYEEASELYSRELAVMERLLGPEHEDLAGSLYSLARLRRRLGEYGLAEDHLERALQIVIAKRGADHPQAAYVHNLLGIVREQTGDYTGSRTAYERAEAIARKSLGDDHPFVASCLNNQGLLLRKIGDYTSARKIYERALKASRESHGPDHASTATKLKNLAELLHLMGEFEGAQPLYEQALEIRVKRFGPEHPEVATTLKGLADLETDTGAFDRAKQRYERAMTIWQKTLSPGDPDLAQVRSGLANVLAVTGEPARALELYRQALKIREDTLGPTHPDLADDLSKLGGLLAGAGETAQAFDAALRAESIARSHLRLTATALPEREALAYATVRASGLNLALSLVARGVSVEARRQVWDSLIRSRAIVLDEMARRHRTVGLMSDTEVDKLIGRLASARLRLANLTVRGPDPHDPGRYRNDLETARQKKERVERELAEKSATFRERRLRTDVGLADVERNLPEGSALVAFVVYTPSLNSGNKAAKAGTATYLAFVLRAGQGKPVVVPLGAAREIDRLVSRWRDEAAEGVFTRGRSQRQAETDYRAVGAELRRAIWDPLGVALSDASLILVVPDGPLHLVNISALPDDRDGYLVEQDEVIHYLSAERDAVAAISRIAAGEGLFALGGPAYDLARSPSDAAANTVLQTRGSSNVGQQRRSSSACGDFNAVDFKPLPATTDEVAHIVALWKESPIVEGKQDPREKEGPHRRAIGLTGKLATEGAFKAGASGNRVLHLATHGFFLDDLCAGAEGSTRGIGGLSPAVSSSRLPVPTESPLLLSGFALAGANRRDGAGPGDEDGILTAEEIAAIDLSGVEWAVLSACDTGVGEVKNGEGVFGLRRAFQIAGAGTIIMSLWAVDDEATRRWMEVLYRGRLEKRLDTAHAVREASVDLLGWHREHGGSGHPFFWAGFVAAGDWH